MQYTEYAYIYIYVHRRIYAYTCVYIYIDTSLYLCVYIHMYVHGTRPPPPGYLYFELLCPTLVRFSSAWAGWAWEGAAVGLGF